jgi:hypothetical protein
MGMFRFTYDDDNLKEIRVICKYDGEKDREDLLDTIKTFCIDSIPDDLQPKVSDLKEENNEIGYLIECEDAEKGEEVLTHIFKYMYLVTRMAMIFKDEFSKGSGNLNVEDLDFNLLRPDIEKVEGMGYRELAGLIGNIEKEGVDNVEN